jgi:hypothetical protein
MRVTAPVCWRDDLERGKGRTECECHGMVLYKLSQNGQYHTSMFGLSSLIVNSAE